MNLNNIIYGDTLKTLQSIEDNSIDMGITSPPYNKLGKKNKGWLVKDVNYQIFNDSMPENEISKHIVKESFAERKAKGKWKNKGELAESGLM